MEYGLANVMEQYEKKYKARQLLGPVSESDFQSFGHNHNMGAASTGSSTSGILNMNKSGHL